MLANGIRAHALSAFFRKCVMAIYDERTVYIVDDDEAVRDSTQELLQCCRYAVQRFSSGRDFLQQFDPAAGICIILDLHMPGISGFQVLDALKARGNTVPIILFSGRSDLTTEEFAYQSGVIALLSKPIDAEQLIGLIHQIESKKAAA
jgi:FixJ family two-component response regulator